MRIGLIIITVTLFGFVPGAQGAARLAEIICEEAWLAATGDGSDWIDVRKRMEAGRLRELSHPLPESVAACAKQWNSEFEVAEFVHQGRILLSDTVPARNNPTEIETRDRVEVPMYGSIEVIPAERSALPEPTLDRRREEYDRLWADSLQRAEALLPKLVSLLKAVIPKVVSR